MTTDRPPGDEPPASAGQAGSADEPTRADEGPRFISRAGPKLHHAIRAFGLDPGGAHCVDFGCSTGGFTHAWLHHGAASVIAVDTGYGVLDYRLRGDERVRVLERTNAMHADPPAELVAAGGARFVSADVSWTPQHLVLLNAARWLSADEPGAGIVTLIKPHYEAASKRHRDRFQHLLTAGALREADARVVTDHVLSADLAAAGLRCVAVTESPIAGGKSSRRRKRPAARGAGSRAGGNREFLALLRRV